MTLDRGSLELPVSAFSDSESEEVSSISSCASLPNGDLNGKPAGIEIRLFRLQERLLLLAFAGGARRGLLVAWAVGDWLVGLLVVGLLILIGWLVEDFGDVDALLFLAGNFGVTSSAFGLLVGWRSSGGRPIVRLIRLVGEVAPVLVGWAVPVSGPAEMSTKTR